MRTISERGLDIIKEFEALRLHSYDDGVGVWTIGYGTTVIDGEPVKPGMTCTREQAEKWLRRDVADCEAAVNTFVKVPLDQPQFDALCSFVYNVGIMAFKTSTLLKRLNAGDYDAAAAQFQRWNKGGGKVLAGLVRRRADEQALFEASRQREA